VIERLVDPSHPHDPEFRRPWPRGHRRTKRARQTGNRYDHAVGRASIRARHHRGVRRRCRHQPGEGAPDRGGKGTGRARLDIEPWRDRQPPLHARLFLEGRGVGPVGRGVGLDVVRREIQALGGRVTIQSAAGQGTTFTIALPLTLAVLEGMLVEFGGEMMVLPLSAILETLRPSSATIHSIGRTGRVVANRDELIPIIDLAEAFGVAQPGIRGGSRRSPSRGMRGRTPRGARRGCDPRPAPGRHQEPRGKLRRDPRHFRCHDPRRRAYRPDRGSGGDHRIRRPRHRSPQLAANE
jgi:hypothetical protein